MADSIADDVLRRDAELRALRSNWESHWQEVAERVLPAYADFTTTGRQGGEKLTDKVFDSTAIVALPRFAAAFQSLTVPTTQQWHKLKVDDPDLEGDKEVLEYLERVTEILFQLRYSPRANFANQSFEAYLSMGAFGSNAMFVDDVLGQHLRYRAIHLAETCWAEDEGGRVDYVSRRYQLEARQAMRAFDPNLLPEKIRNAAEKEPFKKFEFVHCVKPNAERDPRRADARGMAFASYHVSQEGRALVRNGGYRSFPYAIARYVKAPGEVYGRGPGMQSLADIKTLNEMEKTILRAGHRAVDPPLLLADDGALQPFQTRPGGLNYGMVTEDGRPKAIPMQSGTNLPIALDMEEAKRKAVNDSFLVTLFQILVETPQMTATEALLRAQEKGALLAPTAGRLQSEFLGPCIEREIDIASAAGLLPPMPPQLRERGADVRIEYDSPMTRAQRAEEGVGIARTLEALTPVAQIDPSALRVFKWADIARTLGTINGVSQKLMRDEKEMEEADAQAASQQQLAQLVQAAPAASAAAKNIAQIEQIQSSAPTRAIPGASG